MEVVRGVVFDLDDTLYLERDYVASGFRHVALVVEGHCDAAADEVFQFLWSGFGEGIRGDSFDRLLVRYPSLASGWTVGELVQLYRGHQPTIDALPKIKELLNELTRGMIALALVTDGLIAAQSGKIAALGLSGCFDLLVLTDTWGREYRKPHRRGFETVKSGLSLCSEQLVYVGDNPAKDFRAPREMGWQTVRLRLPGQLRYLEEPPAPDYAPQKEVVSVESLIQLLRKLCALEPGTSRGHNEDHLKNENLE